jgi:serine/threonine-protein kinase HipA
LNPTPLDVRARVLSLAIDEADDTADIQVALGMARQCGLRPNEAQAILAEVEAAVAQWRDVAARYGLSAREIDRMASAFEPA